MEDSGSANARTGWLPQHAVLRGEARQVVAVAPMYAKSHSYGEYVFDHGWAQCAGARRRRLLPEAAGRRAVQPGARAAAAAPSGRRRAGRRRWPSALEQACRSLDLSSVHVTFCTEAEWQALGEAGWLQRHRHAVPLGERRLHQLRRLPRRPVVAQAQGAAAGAARCERRRPDLPCAARRRHHGARTGTRSTASTARRWIANGAPPT